MVAIGLVAGYVELSWHGDLQNRSNRAMASFPPHPPQPEHLRRLNEQALQFGLKRYTVFWQIDLLTQPFVWGWLRGQLYLPTKSNVDPIVVNHELAHVSRWDAGLNLMQLLVQAVFWFNPVVWWLNSRIRIEREKCCDEIAIARSRITAKQYCLAVVNTIEKSIRPAPETCILSSVGSTKQLEERIKSMLHAKHIFSNKLSPVSVCLVSLIALTSLTASLRLKASEQKPASPSIPSIWPTQARVAQPYGLGVHPVLKTEYFHRGIDIINRAGLPVLATADGKIILADHKGIQGHTVDIDHGNNITTRYCHLENLMVRVGQTVQRGDQIGTVGNTGVDTSPSHLHYEIITQGRPQNPMDYLSLHNRPANIPTIWPTHARITSPFGRRVNPYTQAHERHRGIDIANQTGEPVVATAAGSVTLAADEGTMGLVVEIDHGNGFTTRYCHLGNLEVKTGQTVQPGQIIGRIGMSGKSTGPHVHYEVLLHGQYQDPINYIQQ